MYVAEFFSQPVWHRLSLTLVHFLWQGLAATMLGFLGMSRWRRSAEPLTEELAARIGTLSEKLGMAGFSRVFISQHTTEAAAMGFLRPVVLLPAALATGMPPEMLEAVIAHELAHIHRLDLWVSLAQRVVETLLFYHPAVWWLSHRLRAERELCCDELAVKATGQRLTYASALENAGRIRLAARQPALALGFGQDAKPTLSRVRHILGFPAAPPDSRAWLAGMIGVAVLGVFIVCVPSSLTARVETRGQVDEAQVGGPSIGQALPQGWSLDYDDGQRAGGAGTWVGGMAKDLASLGCVATGLDVSDASKGNERYEFEIRSAGGERLGTLDIRPDNRDMGTTRMTLKPGKYAIHYTRRFGNNGDNVRMHSGPFTVDLPQPGMYKLRFRPTLGNGEIRGSLGGCYALNFERMGDGLSVTGFAYQNAAKQYTVNGLPAGTYRLSAVTHDERGNTLVSLARATLKGEESLTVDIARSPRGDCSLRGVIAGRPGTYWTPIGTPQQTGRQWFVLIRTRGSGPVEQVGAYEAQTMDSHYVVRGKNIIQETADRASYSISGIAPGKYTVTVIEHPWCEGIAVERQRSQPLTLRPGETATLDFDLGDRPLCLTALPPLEQIGHADQLAPTQGKKLLICFLDLGQRWSRNRLLELNERSESLAAQGIVVLAVQASDVQAGTLDEWLKQNNIAIPIGQINTPKDRIRAAWGAKVLPWLILTDERHTVIAEGVELADLGEQFRRR